MTVGLLKEVGVAIASANGPKKVGVDPQHAQLKGVATTPAQVAHLADSAVNGQIQHINTENAKWGITQTPDQALAQSTFRRGLCGECCDAVLTAFDTEGVTDFYKVNLGHNGEVHYFLQTQDGQRFVEPTWKQIVVSRSEEQHLTEYAQALSRYPAVFVGTREEYTAHIASNPDGANVVKGYWGL
jgi:hypothetical protein